MGKVSGKTGSIYQRLKVHFGDKTDSATNGIKMKMAERKLINNKLEVHVFVLDKQYEEVRLVIIDPVEKILHQLLKPATGNSK
ncbi:MAG: hypothetical protein IKG15_07450 [Solobacterium sp.]|nr:hypothetical protein [Solobacterium sp.]